MLHEKQLVFAQKKLTLAKYHQSEMVWWYLFYYQHQCASSSVPISVSNPLTSPYGIV